MDKDIQEILEDLKERGWTSAAVADELGTAHDTVVKWKSGVSYPALVSLVLPALEALRDKAPPKLRRYPGTHHLQKARQ